VRLELDALEALDAVVSCGSLGRAAEVLQKAQSAISYQLKSLEAQLGVPLIDRSGYRIRLTPAGAAVLAEGRGLLAHAQRVEGLARQFAQGWEARLTIVIDGILPLQKTLAALKTLTDEGVPTRVHLAVEFLGGVQQRFDELEADLMLVKDLDPRAGLAVEALPEIECVLCVAPNHPLARTRGASLAQLQRYVELTVQDSSGRGKDQQFGGERVFNLSDFSAKKQSLLMGLGFGWMPRYLVDAELAGGTLCELDYAGGSRYRFTPWLVYRDNQPPGLAQQRLMALLTARDGVTG
jgi:DNA-binding transcriptional LysR family regulator